MYIEQLNHDCDGIMTRARHQIADFKVMRWWHFEKLFHSFPHILTMRGIVII
jgi:hypothetical protein